MSQPGVRANFSPVIHQASGSAAASAPTYISIDAGDSPYQASNGNCLLVDMSLGDVSVLVPPSGTLCVSRDGEDNDLTLVGTISDKVNPKILYDRSTASMAYITEWRFV